MFRFLDAFNNPASKRDSRVSIIAHATKDVRARVCLQVRAASPDTLDTVGQLTPVFLHEIGNTFNMAAQTGEQREKQAELQGQLCGVLQVRVHSLSQQHDTLSGGRAEVKTACHVRGGAKCFWAC